MYVASMEIMDREGPVLIASFENAKPVIGIQALESLGLKVDPVTSKLETTRPKGLAYYPYFTKAINFLLSSFSINLFFMIF